MPPSGSRLDSPRLLSFHNWCLTCGEGPMGKRWWVGRISSLSVFLSLWFWLWLDWQSATFQGTSYQAQRDLERMMMPFFTEQPAICQLPVMAQRPVSETPAQGCTWTVMGRLKLAYERWTENPASPAWRRRGPAARWCWEPLEGDKSLKAVAHEEGCLLSSAAFLKWMSGAESSIIPTAPGPQNLRLIATGGYSTCISFHSISLQSLFLWLSKPVYWASQVTSGKEFACQCRRCRFNPWVQKIPWRRKWQPTPVFLAGAFHGQRSLVGYSPCST